MKRIFPNCTSCVFMLIVFLGIFVCLQTGCTNKRNDTVQIIGFPQSYADLAEKVRPAVVNISAITTVTIPGNPFRQFFGQDQGGSLEEFFRRFFGDVPDRELRQRSLGSGFIIDEDGYIVTNNHVVERADEISVKLADGRDYKAKVIGRDSKTDIALIKISSLFTHLPFLSLGDSDAMRVGDWVLAIGNPFGLEHTVTQGIISATGRVIGAGPYDNFLQTDAPINPGNSGGSLVNLQGEVIGINTAIVAAGQGIGFAIPINLAKSIVSQLKEKGSVVRGWIGVSVQTVTPEIADFFKLKGPKGVLVGDIIPGGPADKAGIKRGDIIINFDGKEIKDVSDLPRLVAGTPVGKDVNVMVIRGGDEISVTLKVEELKEERILSQAQTPESKLRMRVDNINRRWQMEFGITDESGVVVIDVAPNSQAYLAGMLVGDVITEINRKSIEDASDYKSAMEQAERGKPLLFLVNRRGQAFYVTINIS
ncbi:MAG: HtrA protease/chaperone protein [Candidatus Jettenia ecosi]|uniref:Probable periplasmic serine endoprotease DegP-like n=1 Tax=Candidatus Jettenia ecosi TaxID=2494326 RepID=A0A533QDU4_9BACT|nr:MAG: HtrA protease/chaperone protein [Candidatus Jettenia ecosi]